MRIFLVLAWQDIQPVYGKGVHIATALMSRQVLSDILASRLNVLHQGVCFKNFLVSRGTAW